LKRLSQTRCIRNHFAKDEDSASILKAFLSTEQRKLFCHDPEVQIEDHLFCETNETPYFFTSIHPLQNDDHVISVACPMCKISQFHLQNLANPKTCKISFALPEV
jgi:uncharacterized protein (UPF0210 family)